jgi:uncharacterized protein YpbB
VPLPNILLNEHTQNTLSAFRRLIDGFIGFHWFQMYGQWLVPVKPTMQVVSHQNDHAGAT